MSFEGDRFEYVGTGSEKLRGFLVALGLVFVLWLLDFAATLLLPPNVQGLHVMTSLIYAGGLLLLGQMAPFTAQRYRLSRTRWRGLGGGMHGSAPRYGVVSFLYLLASTLTLFMLSPLRRMRLARRRIRASSFGNVPLRFQGRRGLAFGHFLGAFVGQAMLLALFVAGVFTTLYIMAQNGYRLDAEGTAFQLLLGGVVLLVLLGFPSVNRLCTAWYDTAVLNEVLAQTGYADVRFASTVTGEALFELRLVNAMIRLVTIGLGAPIVRHCCARFVAARVLVTGSFDPARLQLERTPATRDAEGLFEAFDVGFLY